MRSIRKTFRCLGVVAAMTGSVMAYAQDSEDPGFNNILFIEEGTTWNTEVARTDMPDQAPMKVTQRLEGTETVNGQKYIKLLTKVDDGEEKTSSYIRIEKRPGRIYALDPDDIERGERLVYSFTNTDNSDVPFALLVWDGSLDSRDYRVKVKSENVTRNCGYNYPVYRVEIFPYSNEDDTQEPIDECEWIYGVGTVAGFTNQLYPLCKDYTTTLSSVVTSCRNGLVYERPGVIIDDNKVWNYRMTAESSKVSEYQFSMSFGATARLGDKYYHEFKTRKVEGFRQFGKRKDKVSEDEGVSTFYLREDAGKVYIYNRAYGSEMFKDERLGGGAMPDEFLLYDFSLNDGDGYDTYGSLNTPVRLDVESIETVEGNGREWRKFNFGEIECEGRVSPLCAVEGVGFLSGELGSTLVYFNDAAFTGPWGGIGAQYLPIPYANVGLVSMTDLEGNVLFDPEELGFNFNSVESVVADGMTLVSANGIVSAVSESGSEVRVTVYGIDGTVRAEVSGIGEAVVNVSALDHGVYTVRATDGNAVRVLKIRE